MKSKKVLKRTVLTELENIAFSDLTRFVTLETLPDEGQVMTLTDTALLSRKDKRAICSLKAGTRGFELKLYDKLKALELLGRSCGALSGQDDEDEVIDKLRELFDKEDECEAEAVTEAG